jgi:hypothetical protein
VSTIGDVFIMLCSLVLPSDTVRKMIIRDVLGYHTLEYIVHSYAKPLQA